MAGAIATTPESVRLATTRVLGTGGAFRGRDV